MGNRRTGQLGRFVVSCSCGEKLQTSRQYVGSHLECPSCGQPVLVDWTSPQTPSTLTREDVQVGGKKRLLVMWSLVGVVAIGCVLFLVMHTRAERAEAVATANARVQSAIESANEWLEGTSTLDAESIEKELEQALTQELATEFGNGKDVLSQVQRRQEEIRADAILLAAMQHLDDEQFAEATAELDEYIADPYATDRETARRLLEEVETALSDDETLETLVAMSDAQFSRAEQTGSITDGRVKHPVLKSRREESVQRQIEEAATVRKQLKAEEQERALAKQLEAERLEAARMERQRREEEQNQARLRAESQAAELLRRRRDSPRLSPDIEDVANFPDRYADNYVCFKSVAVHGNIERNQYADNRFRVPLTSQRNEYYTGFSSDHLQITTSDTIAEALLKIVDADAKLLRCDVYCEIAIVEAFGRKVPQATVYKIAVYNFGGNIAQVLED